MLQSTRRWFGRNRSNFAIGGAVLGAGYVAGQYALSKFSEARQRMSEDRIAKENLRRRFEQNQEDCSFTVLAILPTATEEIMGRLHVERVLEELQQQKAQRLARSVGPSEIGTSAPPSVADMRSETDGGAGEEGATASRAVTTEGFVHASQIVGEGAQREGDVMGRRKEEEEEEDTAASVKEATPAPVPEQDEEARTTPAPAPVQNEEARTTTKNKAQLWDEMKISSITRSLTLLYTIALLTLLTRIQLNLLGRRNYLASVVSLAAPQPPSTSQTIHLQNNDDDGFEQSYGNDFETNRRYLSLSWWLLHRGCVALIDRVRDAVEGVFGVVNPREEITLERLGELVIEVRRRVEGATEEERRRQKWLSYLLPPPDQIPAVLSESGMPPTPTPSPCLQRLIDETSDIVDSPSFSHVLTLLLDAAYSHLIDNRLSQLAFKIPPISESTARVVEVVGTGHKAKVANCLAVFCRQAAAIGAGGGSNDYLSAIEQVSQLEAFSAVVYSSNFEYESPDASAAEVAEKVERLVEQETGVAKDMVQEVAAKTQEGVDKMELSFEHVWDKALAKEDGKPH